MTSPFEPTLSSPQPTSSDGDEAYCPACNRSYGVDELFCPTDGTRLVKLVAKPDSLIGRVFDARYEVRAILGHGGMGTVYRGWQLSVDREVAIKVIHPKLATVRAVAKRFLREARLSSRLQHPAIVSVFDFGQADDGVLYIVMEFLRGKPLSDEVKRGNVFAASRIARIATQICEALDAAHREGIVHRDLKPHNVMLLDGDRVKVLDFGLAKSFVAEDSGITGTDALLGTPQYMPPEQILGKEVDQRADIYALGCMLYQMAAGRPPFDNNLATNVLLNMHLHEPVPGLPDEVPRPLASLIMRCLAKDPAQRPASAILIKNALDALAEGQSNLLLHTPPPAEALAITGVASAPTPVPSTQHTRRSPVAVLGGIALAVGAIAGGIGAYTVRSHQRAALVSHDAAPAAPAVVDAAVVEQAAPRPAIDAGVVAVTPDAAPAKLDKKRVPPHTTKKADGGINLPDVDLVPDGN
ncbi:MAG: serine/threonine-protein kinase [Kofleriaceae bacterium]